VDWWWERQLADEGLGLIKPDHDRPVYLTIPEHRRIAPRPGLVIHRDRHWADRLARAVPPRRTAAHAVLDVVGRSRTLDEAAAVVAEACQTGRVGAADLLAALDDRRRLRHRQELRPIIADVAAGSHSLLELRYQRDVEQRHGLPTGQRQRAVDDEYTDVHYDGLNVELDGRLHLAPRQQWRDLDRDNRATLRGEATLRYGWFDITSRPCAAAVQVLAGIRRRKPATKARACSPSCPIR
jgi:hypothetical protein